MKKETGFALLPVSRQKEIASMGGKACPASARTFSNREKAVEAGKKGAAVRTANLWKAKQHLLAS